MEVTRDLGIDFHSNRFTVDCFEGEKHRRKTYELEDREIFYQGLRPTDSITVEAMTGVFSFVRELGDRAENVKIVNPAKLYPGGKRNKTDKIDARYLAEMGRMGRYSIRDSSATVYLVDERMSELRSLVSGQRMLTKEIVMLKNRVHAILKDHLKPFNGKNLNTESVRKAIMELEIPVSALLQIKMYLDLIDVITEKKDLIEEQIKSFARYYREDMEILISIPGVSLLIAMVLLSDYVDISRFASSRKFCSYLRTGLTIKSSNQKTWIGHVNRASRKAALTMLLQGLSHVWQSENPIRQYRERKQAENMKNGKLRIAIARKIMTAMFYMLRDRKKFKYMKRVNYERKMEELKKYL